LPPSRTSVIGSPGTGTTGTISWLLDEDSEELLWDEDELPELHEDDEPPELLLPPLDELPEEDESPEDDELELSPFDEDIAGVCTGLSSPPSPEQDMVNVMANARVAANIV
jgi:hypothetical protein